MSSVPTSPSQFFSVYLPGIIQPAAERLGVVLSSTGSVAFRLLEQNEEYSLRLDSGALVCSPGIAGDVLLQITLTQTSFELLLVRSAERATEGPPDPERQLFLLRALAIDQERAERVLQSVGSVALEIRDPEQVERAWLTPGLAVPDLDHPTCRILIDRTDFTQLVEGKVVPLELLLAGKVVIEGNAQGLMALGALLG